MMKRKETLRLRISTHGLQVFVGGKWIIADEHVTQNIRDILNNMYPSAKVV
jgi:hypothetical protein